jgi:hypothetical protein
MNVELLGDKDIVAHNSPLAKRVETDVILWFNISGSKSAKDGLLASADTCVLTHEDQTNARPLLFIDCVLEARH